MQLDNLKKMQVFEVVCLLAATHHFFELLGCCSVELHLLDLLNEVIHTDDEVTGR